MAMNDDMSNITDEMRARYQELRDKEDSGMLDDAGRMELKEIKTQMGINQ